MKLAISEMTEKEFQIYSGIREAQAMMHSTALHAGWYKDPATGEKKKRNVGELLMLMVSELAEALEADRKDLMDDKLPHRKGIEVELADCMIRILDAADYLCLDLAGAILEKNRYNEDRIDHRLENRAVAGGKKY